MPLLYPSGTLSSHPDESCLQTAPALRLRGNPQTSPLTLGLHAPCSDWAVRMLSSGLRPPLWPGTCSSSRGGWGREPTLLRALPLPGSVMLSSAGPHQITHCSLHTPHSLLQDLRPLFPCYPASKEASALF